MSNQKFLKVMSVVFVLVLLAAVGMKFLPFAYAEQYSVGDAEITSNIRNLDVQWTSGKVNIAYHSKNTVIISEKTTGVISEDMRMRWRLDGDTLRIEYDKPGFHLFSLIPHDKELTVTLPKGLTLEQATISLTSGDLVIPALYADSVTLSSTSGDMTVTANARRVKSNLTSGSMKLSVMNMAEEIMLGSTSGNITLESAGAENKVVIESTSGSIRAIVNKTGELKVGSTSGSIYAVIGQAKKTDIGSTSGSVYVEISGMETLNIHTTSGGVTAYLPAAPGFTAQVKTVSGRFESQLPLIKQENAYIAGDGSAKVNIQTTSGNVTLGGKEN